MEPVAEILPRLNYGLAPRSKQCWVCKSVGAPEDVTLRLLDEEGVEQPIDDAVDYLVSCGYKATRETWRKRLASHVGHVQRSMARNTIQVITPAHLERGLVPQVAPPSGSPGWLRTTDKAVDLGDVALTTLAERLEAMSDTDLLAAARLGQAAAAKRGDWEAKGRQLGQMDALMRLAFGAGRANDR